MKKLTLSLILIIGFLIISCSSDDSNNNDQTDNPPEVTVTTSDFSTTIDENPDENQVLGIIQGVTNVGSVSFSILSQSPNGALSINATTGQLTINNETLFDFETNPIISATIKVANGSIYETSNVIISLNDIEESNSAPFAHLYSQEQVDEFGAHGYTNIENDLIIKYQYGSPITSIQSLSTLISIEGDLRVEYTSLTSLEGLNNIETVGRDLTIYRNGPLTNLNGLDNLTTVNRVLTIRGNNDGLTSIDGIENLSYVGDDVYIAAHIYITNVDGLSGLLNVGGDLWIGNNTLTNLCGIYNLLNNNGLVGEYNLSNGYNPTIEDILNGNCQL